MDGLRQIDLYFLLGYVMFCNMRDRYVQCFVITASLVIQKYLATAVVMTLYWVLQNVIPSNRLGLCAPLLDQALFGILKCPLVQNKID